MKLLGRMLFVFSMTVFLLAGCTGINEAGTEMPEEVGETAQSAQQGESLDSILQGEEALYPVVVSSEPALGEQLIPDGKVSIVFDQSMETGSVEEAWFLVSSDGDEITGTFLWQQNDTKIVFSPKDEFENGLQYDLTISETAQSSAGISLEGGFEQTFYTEMPVQVSQVFPEAGSKEVDTYTSITAIFNQPVVSLKIVEEQNTLVQPLEFDPPVSGSGEWVNSSVYVFQPDQAAERGSFLHDKYKRRFITCD